MNEYDLLGVRPNATRNEIKSAYRKKALEIHPDKNNVKSCEEFIKVKAAYEKLINKPVKFRNVKNNITASIVEIYNNHVYDLGNFEYIIDISLLSNCNESVVKDVAFDYINEIRHEITINIVSSDYYIHNKSIILKVYVSILKLLDGTPLRIKHIDNQEYEIIPHKNHIPPVNTIINVSDKLGLFIIPDLDVFIPDTVQSVLKKKTI